MGIIKSKKQDGYAIVVLVIILMVATAIGLFGLRSSQSTLKKTGVRRNVAELKYQSEQGLQKAVQRIQIIAQNPPGTINEPDVIAVQNADASGTTGGDYTEKDILFLVDSMDEEFTASPQNPECDDWDPLENFDDVTGNVVCNFLGVNEEGIHVALVRKDDLDPGSGDDDFAIFLINSIAYDDSGRRQITQGAVVVPYNSATDTLTPGETPYLSNSKTVLD